MKTLLFILFLFPVVLLPGKEARAQAFAVKSWQDTYPRMNGRYPLTFIAFRGKLIPLPHLFIRIWPSYYYVEAGALPVADGTTYTGLLKINLGRIIARELEKSQMARRSRETEQIKTNLLGQRDIARKILDSRSDQLPDIYGIVTNFARLYSGIRQLDRLKNCHWLEQTCKNEADRLLERFVMINLFHTGHGEKLEAFARIKEELDQQIGETDYCYRKVYHYQFCADNFSQSYRFLAE